MLCKHQINLHTLTVVSSELDTTNLPELLIAQHVTMSLWPRKSASSIPVDASHSYRENTYRCIKIVKNARA